jgi:hypothetical protein
LKKRLIYSFLLFFVIFQAFGQKPSVKNRPEYDDKPLHFGYTLGLNVMDFTFVRTFPSNSNIYTDIPSKTLGFQVGMIGDMRLGEYLNARIQPGFIFGQRNLLFFDRNSSGTDTVAPQQLKIESSMIDLPILLKYRSKRINNYRPYFIGGVAARYDLASKKEFDEDTKDFILLKPLDFYIEMGFGIDFYLPYFKLATEIKLSLGLLDVLNTKAPDKADEAIYVKSLESLKSNIVMISIHIE